MRVRSWLIRGLILAGVAALVACAWIANTWISPERVREKVIASLNDQFDDVDVHVGSARMRILGGIAVEDLRLTRRGDPPEKAFLIVPQAILYHDKEQLNHGRLVIKKVELDGPTLVLERSASGKWNVEDIMKPSPADRPVPTFVVKNGTVSVIDHTPDALPPVTFTDVQCTLLNDPLPMLTLQGQARAGEYGEASVRARFNRINKHLSVSVELPHLPLGATAQAAAQRFAPELAPHLTKLSASASVRAELTYSPDTAPQWRHDIRLDVRDARFEHPDLPWPIEKITATVRSVNGQIRVDDATAQIGPAKLRLSLETRPDAPPPQPGAPEDTIRRFEDRLMRLEATATGVPLTDSVFERMPDVIARARKTYNPTGSVDLGYKFVREAAGWRREVEIRPRQAAMVYEQFRYPVSDVRGVIKRTITHSGSELTTFDLVGTGAGQLITLTGRIEGDGPDPAITLRITGNNIPIDDALITAMPPEYAGTVRAFRASGHADFVAEIRQKHGVNLCENEFRVTVRDAKMSHASFPYPLEKMKGRLVIRSTATDEKRPVRPGEPLRPLPDRDEIVFTDFTATHAGAPIWLSGEKVPVPGTRDRKLTIRVGARGLPIDADLKGAFAAANATDLWVSLAPRGVISFAADIEVLDRAPPPDRPGAEVPLNPATDLKLTLRFEDATVTPEFFKYELTDVKGWLQYKNNRLDVAHVTARHGPSRVALNAADVRFYPDGSTWANLGGIEVNPLIPNAELKKALPGKLGSALDDIQLKGGAQLTVKHLVVHTAPEHPVSGGRQSPVGLLDGQNRGPTPTARPDPVVYWDAELKLFGASLDTGVEWQDVYGVVASRGRYEGTHMGAMRGTVWLDRATVSRMPLTAAKCQLRIDPQVPDPGRLGQYLAPTAQFTNVNGDLFGGTLGGEAHVVLSEQTRFEVLLTVTGAQLEEVARVYKLGSEADLKGVAQAKLLVYNRLDPKTGKLVVEGSGKIDVPSGRMYNLPILLDLVKVFKLERPDKTAFDEAHAVFRIAGDRIKVDQIDLIGKAVCVSGSGELDTSGDYVKFEFYTIWSQVLKRLGDTPAGELTAFLSRNLLTIKMERVNGELKYRAEAVPLVTDPARAAVERLRRYGARVFGK